MQILPASNMAYETPTPTSGQTNGNKDVVIAVMGGTGSGKSDFNKLLTGDERIIIGNDIESETNDVQDYIMYDRGSGRKVKILDTPGFDNSRNGVTDTDILRKISEFLVNKYDMNKKLNGLLYFHRISDPRFGGEARRNLWMFRHLCGTEAYPNVVIVTTFWDSVTDEIGTRREEQLRSTAFKDLVEGGAHFMRHDRTLKSALEVVRRILTFTPRDPRIVEEIQKEEKSLEETEAGPVRREEIDHFTTQHKQELEFVQAEMATVHAHNAAMRQELQEERERLQRELGRWEAERSELKEGLGRLAEEAEVARREHAEWRGEQERRMEAQRQEHEALLQLSGFLATSRDVRLLDSVLWAQCIDRSGQFRNSSLALDAYLGNVDGHFAWGSSRGFSQSAMNVRLNGSVLSAELNSKRGTWQDATIDLNQFIWNNYGVLEPSRLSCIT